MACYVLRYVCIYYVMPLLPRFIMIIVCIYFRTRVVPLMEETCLADSGSTNTILRDDKYFESIQKSPGSIMTIAGCGPKIVGSGRATIVDRKSVV